MISRLLVHYKPLIILIQSCYWFLCSLPFTLRSLHLEFISVIRSTSSSLHYGLSYHSNLCLVRFLRYTSLAELYILFTTFPSITCLPFEQVLIAMHFVQNSVPSRIILILGYYINYTYTLLIYIHY